MPEVRCQRFRFWKQIKNQCCVKSHWFFYYCLLRKIFPGIVRAQSAGTSGSVSRLHLSEQNPSRFQTLSENQSVSIITRSLAERTDHEISPAIRHTHISVSVDPNLPVILDLNRTFVAVVSTEDYHAMGERLFNALYELNISKIQLFPSSEIVKVPLHWLLTVSSLWDMR